MSAPEAEGRIATEPERPIAEELIARFDLDLSGLEVLTEAASGTYLCTPLLAALAGAERVHGVTADSGYASKEEVRDTTVREAEAWGVGDRVEVAFSKSEAALGAADIVTNSGFVRPIDADTVAALKPTAVVPLMWETWEFRPQELDLDACRGRGILVLGTNESSPPCDMRGYSGPLAMKLLSELGVSAPGRIVLLGGQPSLGGQMARALPAEGWEVEWFSKPGEGGRPYEELERLLPARAAEYDAILVAEHSDPRMLLGEAGLLAPAELARANPDLRVGVIAGNVEAPSLEASGLRFAPSEIGPFGYTTYQPSELGPRPVLELYAAGLKVGEAMARARLAGSPPRQAALEALERSPAMDFTGELAWT